jgi:hypothetical protein
MPVQVFGDSMLVIRQAKGEWECNHAGLQDRLRQAQLLLQTLAKRGYQCRLQQLPREQNKDADALANKAMDTKSSEIVITSSIAEILAPIPSSPAMSGAAPASSQPASPSTQPDCNLARDPTPPADIVTCVVELNQLPTAREVSELASQIHLESRVLCALPPSTLWSEAMKHRWTQACAALTPKLKAALDDGSDLSLMQALLDTNTASAADTGEIRGKG